MKNKKRHLYILAWLIYISFSMLAFPYLRITVMLFSIPLAMVGGWLYRYRGALATTALSIPYHFLLININSNDRSLIIEAFNPFGIASLVVFSLSTALLQSLKQRYQKLNDDLECIIEERTKTLRQLANQLAEMHILDRSLITSGMLDTPLQELESMRKTCSLLCTHLEAEKHQERVNATVVQKYIQQCIKSLTDFMSKTENAAETDATLSERIEKFSEKMIRLGAGKLTITMDGMCDQLDRKVTRQLYSIISEAISNAIRHAGAAEIKIQCRQDSLSSTICVENDGETLPDRYQEGMGLPLMRHRAMSIDGSITIEGGPGQRTRLICTVTHKAPADEKAFPRDGQRLNTTA